MAETCGNVQNRQHELQWAAMVRTRWRDLSARQVSPDTTSVLDKNGEDLTMIDVIRRIVSIERILADFLSWSACRPPPTYPPLYLS